jgi:hypothetical protein
LLAFVAVQDSKWAKTGRSLQMQIMKADKEEEEHWPRITKEKAKLSWLQTDWGRYVDEDEEDEKPADMGAPCRRARPLISASL